MFKCDNCLIEDKVVEISTDQFKVSMRDTKAPLCAHHLQEFYDTDNG